MKIVARMALVAALVFPAAASDVVVHRETHTDAYSTSVKTNPATVSEEVLWIGEDRMRVEEGNRVIIVRADLKKMYVLDMQAKTKTTIDLPVDLKKYVRPEEAPMIEKLVARTKPTVTPTGRWKAVRPDHCRPPFVSWTTGTAGAPRVNAPATSTHPERQRASTPVSHRVAEASGTPVSTVCDPIG